MKKKFLKKLLITFSVTSVLIYSAIFACVSDYDLTWFYETNFTPETFVDKTYYPLFLSQDLFYSNDSIPHGKKFNIEMVDDWKVYLEENINKIDLDFFLLGKSNDDVKNLYNFYSTNKPNKFAAKWSKKLNLSNNKIHDFIEFLFQAQKIEKYSTKEDYKWTYNANKNHLFDDLNWIKKIEKKYEDSTDPFLKNRYWFQTIKAYFYSNYQSKAIDFYNKTEVNIPKNNLYYRAMAYVSGVLYRQKNYAVSNFMYSQVFDKCPKLRYDAAYNFHPHDNSDWENSLKLAQTNEQKSALWAIQGYYGDEKKAIEKIYELDSKSKHLDFLLIRLINTQEIDNSLSIKNIKELEKYKFSKDSLLFENIKLISKIEKEEKTDKPYLWSIALGYLNTLNKNYREANILYDKSINKMPKTALALNQLRILKFVNYLSSIDKINAEIESKIIPELIWIYNELPAKKDIVFRYIKSSSWSKTKLASLYKSDNKNTLSELFDRKPDFYNSESNMQAMETLMKKENKSKMEEIGLSIYNVTLDDIFQYQYIRATFENKISEAIKIAQKTKKFQQTNLTSDPFNGKIKDCNDCDFNAYQKRKYKIIEFLEAIKKMQDEIAINKSVYKNAILLGNAFYSITIFGNAHIFHECNIMGNSFNIYDYKGKDKEMVCDYSLAKMYYNMAFEAAKNNEEKAKCQYMLSKCQRNEYYVNQSLKFDNSWDALNISKNFIAWEGFKNLKNIYSNTKYYKEVISQCGYFKTFINQDKKKKKGL